MTHSFPTRRSSDLDTALEILHGHDDRSLGRQFAHLDTERFANRDQILDRVISAPVGGRLRRRKASTRFRSEEHTSELQSLMSISYAVFRLEKKICTHAN